MTLDTYQVVEIGGVVVTQASTRQTTQRSAWHCDPDRAHFIINLSSTMRGFGAAMGARLYLGAPSVGEYSWIPKGAHFSGWYGSGAMTFLEITAPQAWADPATPHLAAFDFEILELSRQIATNVATADHGGLADRLHTLWSLLQRTERRFAKRRGSLLSDQRFEEVQRGVHDNLGSIRSAYDMADLTGAGLDGLNRTFQSYLGLSASQYLSEARLRTARRLICKSDASMGEIAARAGFRSQAHLSSKVAKRFGMAPKALRRMGHVSQIARS